MARTRRGLAIADRRHAIDRLAGERDRPQIVRGGVALGMLDQIRPDMLVGVELPPDQILAGALAQPGRGGGNQPFRLKFVRVNQIAHQRLLVVRFVRNVGQHANARSFGLQSPHGRPHEAAAQDPGDRFLGATTWNEGFHGSNLVNPAAADNPSRAQVEDHTENRQEGGDVYALDHPELHHLVSRSVPTPIADGIHHLRTDPEDNDRDLR